MKSSSTTGSAGRRRQVLGAGVIAPLAVALAVSACGGGSSSGAGGASPSGGAGASAGAASSGGSSGGSASGGSYTIGSSSILSGPAAVLGAQLDGGMNAYFKNVNAHGGVNGKQIKLDTADGGLTASATIQALKTLVSSDHSIVVGGLLDSSGTEGAHSTIEALKTAVLEATPVLQDVRPQAGPYFFGGGGPVYPDNAHLQFEFAKQQVIKKPHPRIALIYDISASATQYGNEIKKLAQQNGYTVVDSEPYQVGTTSFASQAAKLAAAKPDYIFGSFDASNFAFLKALKTAGVTAPVLADQGGPTAHQLAQLDYPGIYVQSAYSAYNYAGDSSPAVKRYRQLIAKYGGGVDPGANITQYGYLEAQVIVAVLKKCGAHCNTASFASTLGGMHTISTGGFSFAPVTYSKANAAGVPTNAFYTYNTSSKKLVQMPHLYSYPSN